MRNDSWLKLTGVTLLGILGLWLVYALIFSSGIGMGINYNGNYGGGHMYYGTGLGFGSLITFCILLLIKVLFVVFVISLIATLVLWIKNYFLTTEDLETIKKTFAGGNQVAKEKCEICGCELLPEWKVCPQCGKEKAPTV